MPSTGEWLQLFLLLLGPLHALGVGVLAGAMRAWGRGWSVGLRVSLLVANGLVAVAPVLSGISVARENSWFRSIGYGGAALEVLALVALALAVFSRPREAPRPSAP